MRPARTGERNSNWRGGKSSHPLYDIYMDMIGRCHRPTHQRYADYGGRGITVCDRWRADFWAFVEDMGPRPEGLTLDREDNDKGYSPENCRWATSKEQRHNRRPERPRKKCPNGHRYTPENTRVSAKGHQECVTCAEATAARWAPRNAERRRRTRRTGGESMAAKRAATAKLVRDYEELGGDYPAIIALAEQLGISRAAIKARLGRAGAQVPDGRALMSKQSPVVRQSRFSDADIDRMCALYREGNSQARIAEVFATQQSHVGVLLRRAGVQMRFTMEAGVAA